MKRTALLPREEDGAAEEAGGHGGPEPGRVFECKTCNRTFPTFQALGGHRTGHRKPKLPGEGSERGGPCAKPKVHECSVCGVEFAIGQALGGHMRRHKGEAEGSSAERTRLPQADGLHCFDLNQPPVEEEISFLSLGLGSNLA
ncbi:hypothetical protein Taro_046787 [Colocasia esculenta]|uniref:C2H2-type domain-containing protein n=1 Tax=Colocasia esculenta TaxID=4460 RepID=A0A843X4K9_COLES|nr:hypothetical protein [Colocasia esculenta]